MRPGPRLARTLEAVRQERTLGHACRPYRSPHQSVIGKMKTAATMTSIAPAVTRVTINQSRSRKPNQQLPTAASKRRADNAIDACGVGGCRTGAGAHEKIVREPARTLRARCEIVRACYLGDIPADGRDDADDPAAGRRPR